MTPQFSILRFNNLKTITDLQFYPPPHKNLFTSSHHKIRQPPSRHKFRPPPPSNSNIVKDPAPVSNNTSVIALDLKYNPPDLPPKPPNLNPKLLDLEPNNPDLHPTPLDEEERKGLLLKISVTESKEKLYATGHHITTKKTDLGQSSPLEVATPPADGRMPYVVKPIWVVDGLFKSPLNPSTFDPFWVAACREPFSSGSYEGGTVGFVLLIGPVARAEARDGLDLLVFAGPTSWAAMEWSLANETPPPRPPPPEPPPWTTSSLVQSLMFLLFFLIFCLLECNLIKLCELYYSVVCLVGAPDLLDYAISYRYDLGNPLCGFLLCLYNGDDHLKHGNRWFSNVKCWLGMAKCHTFTPLLCVTPTRLEPCALILVFATSENMLVKGQLANCQVKPIISTIALPTRVIQMHCFRLQMGPSPTSGPGETSVVSKMNNLYAVLDHLLGLLVCFSFYDVTNTICGFCVSLALTSLWVNDSLMI